MNGRVLRVLLLAALASAAACGGDEAKDEQGSAGFALPGEEPYVSPGDSARAAEAVQAHAAAVRDSLRRAAGEPREDDAPAAAPPAAPDARYLACMARVDEEDPQRDRLRAACEALRGPSRTDAP